MPFTSPSSTLERGAPARARRAARVLLPICCLVGVGLGLFLFAAPASSAPGDAELEAARKRGEELWKQAMSTEPGAKTCAACHDRGPNRLTAARLASWPKFDRFLHRVATGQEKINQMIEKQAKGTPLELGHADLTALEVYIKSR